jgi:2-amino-4-hydroxy-6-hydroxymethyldihydropteridine diphosphokinase
VPRCWIALGGNVGDVRDTFKRAFEALGQQGLMTVRRSRLFDTTPVGAAAGARFLNAAAELETALPPLGVLDALQSAEAAAGRVRGLRWGPRPLDLDLLLYEGQRIETERLTVPHPPLWYRRFVLDPLTDIAPDVRHPVFGVTIAELRSRLLRRPLPVSLQGHDARQLLRELATAFPSQIEMVPRPESAVIVLQTGDADASGNAPNVVHLVDTVDAVQAARDVLTAALDEPRPLE